MVPLSLNGAQRVKPLGKFNNPAGVAIDSEDNVYITDVNNNRIQKFTSDGTFITSWGSEGEGEGQFSEPEGIDIDPEGNVYVADTGNFRIQVFRPA
jgi:DNA-binding beta-propeller fold protein YncE